MKTIQHDLKIPNFNGIAVYEHEYYPQNGYEQYMIFFMAGEITRIIKTKEGETYEVDITRWKSEFWKKLPSYVHFDDGRWKRLDIYTLKQNYQSLEPVAIPTALKT